MEKIKSVLAKVSPYLMFIVPIGLLIVALFHQANQ